MIAWFVALLLGLVAAYPWEVRAYAKRQGTWKP